MSKYMIKTENLRGNGWMTFLSVVMLVTGIAAFIFPLFASLSYEILVGAAFFVAGVATLIQAFQEKQWQGVIWQLAIGVLYILGGLAFLANPFGGLVALTIFLGIVFAVEGVLRIVLAFNIRPESRWGLVLASGGVSLLLGILVLAGIANGASLAVIGVLLAVNFIFAGAAFLAIGLDKPQPASVEDTDAKQTA